MRAQPEGTRALDILAATLVPVSSFVHFVRSQGYPILEPEILLVLLGVAAVGAVAGVIVSFEPRVFGPIVMAALVFWFLDVNVRVHATSPLLILALTAVASTAALAVFLLRDHLGRVGSAVFGTVLLSTLVLQGNTSAMPTPDTGAAPDRPHLPVVVHLILDEHVGLAGIPDDTDHGRGPRDRLEAFYEGRGFYTFPRAFSQYFHSRHAISHALNFAETFDVTLVRKTSGAFAWRMSRNAYLEHMRRRGYRLQVYQPDYMSLCPEPPAAGERCHTYRASSLEVIHGTPLSTPSKLRIVASMYLLSSKIYGSSRAHYEGFRSGRFGRRLALPEWNWERARPHAIAAMSAFDRMRGDLSQARPGDLFLGYLLIPHFPYVYDATCALRMDLGEWLERRLPEGAESPNSARSRLERYTSYLEQVECVTRKIDEMLAALRERGVLDRAVILVHGDHGSRITRTDPVVSNREKLTPPDFTDSFSTLFAVRAPGVTAGADDRPWSLVELMRHFVTVDFHGVPLKGPDQRIADVYIRKDGTDTYQSVPPRMAWSRGSGGSDR